MREFLKGLDLDKETIDTIMAEHGKLMQANKETIETLTKQVKDANEEIKSFKDMDIDGIKAKSTEWETKYNELVKNQEEAKNKSIREERTNAFFNEVKFASESAKAGVIAKFNEKDFKYDEETGKFQGASEWLEELKSKDSGAFLSDVANPKFATNVSAPIQNSTNDEIRRAMGLSTEKK